MKYQDSHPGYEEINLGDIHLIEPHLLHAASSLSWISNKDVVQYMGADFSNPSLAKEEERILEIIESSDRYSWMIECQKRLIGNICINSIKEETEKNGIKAGSLAILIGDPQFWKQGIATSACTAVLEWAEQKGGFKAITSRVLQENIGSKQTLKKLGFQEIDTEPYEGLIDGKKSTWHNFKCTLE